MKRNAAATTPVLFSLWSWTLTLGLLSALGCSSHPSGQAQAVTPEVPSSEEFTFNPSAEIKSSSEKLSRIFAPALGMGVNASETKTFRNCIDFKPLKIDKVPLSRHSLNEKMVQSFEDVARATNISLEAQAKAYWGGFDVGLNNIAQSSISKKNINWLVVARYELESQSIDNRLETLKLAPMALALLEDPKKSFEDFFDLCGTHFYSGETRGGLFTALFVIDMANEASFNALKGKISSDGWGVLQGKANFETTMSRAKKSNSFEFYYDIQGGDDQVTHGLSSGTWSTNKVIEAVEMLKTSVYSRQQGVVLNRALSAYEDVFYLEFQQAKQLRMNQPNAKKIDVADDYRSDGLKQYFLRLKHNEAVMEDIHHQLHLLEDELQGTGAEMAYIAELKKILDELTLENANMAQKAQACLHGNNAACVVKDTPLRKAPAPDRNTAYDFLAGWDLWFDREAELEENFYTVNLYGNHTDFPDTGCQFSTDVVFTQHYDVEMVEMHVPIGGGEHDRKHIGSGPIRIRNPLTPSKCIPFVCREQFGNVCQLRFKRLPSVKSSNHPHPSEHRLQMVTFDDFGKIEYKKTLVPICKSY